MRLNKIVKTIIGACILKKNKVISHYTNEISSSVFEGYNFLERGTFLSNVTMGKHSYTGKNVHLVNTVIGRFCSIGPGVHNIGGRHPISECISTHSAFYRLSAPGGKSFICGGDGSFQEYKWVDTERQIQNVVGNDVWIGTEAKIMEGVTIGNGAVIAAGALVTKDIPTYAVVGGIPAKVIRYRFDKQEIELLEKINWWDLDDDNLIKLHHSFTDIQFFINEALEIIENENG